MNNEAATQAFEAALAHLESLVAAARAELALKRGYQSYHAYVCGETRRVKILADIREYELGIAAIKSRLDTSSAQS